MGSPPERFWDKFLILLIVGALLVLIFDGWVFWKFLLQSEVVLIGEESVLIPDLNREVLGRVFEKIEAKEARLKERLSAPPLADPS